ncbi:hypothetical protein RJ640_000564 [Escallonia rubra]|uniref:Uncharacterized protein n=1 Tax=Escallonia rubra TaxID=112253 RepID=A0AA88S126_9ASTE|nr:hypothetical protein RJ640_000564 [Escallonia rubra]
MKTVFISKNLWSTVENATATKEAWDILQKEFQGNAKVTSIKLQSLRRQLENLKMKDFEGRLSTYTAESCNKISFWVLQDEIDDTESIQDSYTREA